MKHSNPKSDPKAPKSEPSKPFKDMTQREKVVFVIQVLICILSFGMIYPNAFG